MIQIIAAPCSLNSARGTRVVTDPEEFWQRAVLCCPARTRRPCHRRLRYYGHGSGLARCLHPDTEQHYSWFDRASQRELPTAAELQILERFRITVRLSRKYGL